MRVVDNFSKYKILEDGSIIGYYGRKLKPAPNTQGYLTAKLTDDSGRLRNVTIHRIVAAAYHGLDLSKADLTVDHINGDKLDNSKDNLEIVSMAENYNRYLKAVNAADTDTHCVCKKCNILKAKREFDKSSRNAKGVQSYCKPCRKLIGQQRRGLK